MQKIVEICCGSLEDACLAEEGGAQRIELNTGLYLGGLTPSQGLLELVLDQCQLPVVAMARPRGGGFCYSHYEKETLMAEVKALCQTDIQGIAFGALQPDGKIDIDFNQRLIDIMLAQGKDPVFHRAFDCTPDPLEAMEALIELKVKRILTSGQAATAPEGVALLTTLQVQYGKEIELLAGSGLRAENVRAFIQATGIQQVHSSCRHWRLDPTTIGKVSYAYGPKPHEADYEVADLEKVKAFVLETRA